LWNRPPAWIGSPAPLLPRKSGVFTGRYTINPLTQESIPIWVANFVLMDYGTGAIMAVPAHDQRDFEFAKKYDLPIRVVIQPLDRTLDANTMTEAYVDEGQMVNSGPFTGSKVPRAVSESLNLLNNNTLDREPSIFALRIGVYLGNDIGNSDSNDLLLQLRHRPYSLCGPTVVLPLELQFSMGRVHRWPKHHRSMPSLVPAVGNLPGVRPTPWIRSSIPRGILSVTPRRSRRHPI
jgi:hypothetical protein